MIAKVRNVLEKYGLLPQANVIEQDKMLVQLAHIAHMWNHGKAEFLCKEANREKFAHACQPRAVSLHVVDGGGLEEILEGDPIWNVLARGDFDGGYFARQQSVSADVVGVRGLLNPGGMVDGKLA